MSGKSYDPRMHTTEHILNGTMVKQFGCARAFDMHLEKKKSKCDFHFDRALTPSELELVASAVNTVISRRLPVTARFVSPAAAAAEGIDTSKLPSDALSSDIRVVDIGDYDSCACIGAHVANTGDIRGVFRITSASHADGVLRLRWTVK